ncbi:MAG: hypothetical protein V1749_05135, partial [Candidatus Desantisbacteria bacterium]
EPAPAKAGGSSLSVKRTKRSQMQRIINRRTPTRGCPYGIRTTYCMHLMPNAYSVTACRQVVTELKLS